MQGRSKRMINCHDCSQKCHILHQAISDHPLKSICLLLLRQSKAIKRELCLSGLIQLTSEDNNRKWMWLLTDYESYQCSPRLEYICQWVCDQHAFCCHSAHFHQWAKVSSWEHRLFLLSVFVYCTGVVVLVSHSWCWKDLGEGFEKAYWVLFKLGITQTVGSLRQLSVYSVTQANTHYIHIGTHHTNKLERTHHNQKSNTCTRPALEPQQSTAVLMGATCCYCGLCGNAGMLPALQPSSHWMNPVPWQQVTWSSGLWATACLPACSTVSAAFNHSSFWLQLREPPHSIQISVMQERCHTLSLSLGHWGQSHVFMAGSRKSGRHHHTTSFISDQ